MGEDDTRDPLAPFDRAVLERVADERGEDIADVADLVRRHQLRVRELPGVANLVYEWRRYLPYDPQVARTETAYHLVVLDSVWEGFGEAGFEDAELATLQAIHDVQARASARERGDDESVFDGAAAVVLARP